MAEETAGRSYKWISLLVAFFCGGLGGSVFTWYVNRPKPTIVTYRVATTTLSAPEASGLIPDLKVLIRGNPIQALYADNIELLPRQGPFMDQAEVAFSFSSPVHIYGIHLESPSVLHHVDCSRFPDPTTEISDVKCTIGPIQFRGDETRPFRVTIGTNGSDAPRVLIAAKNLELVPADQFSPKGQWDTVAFRTRPAKPSSTIESPPIIMFRALMFGTKVEVWDEREESRCREAALLAKDDWGCSPQRDVDSGILPAAPPERKPVLLVAT